MAPHKSDTRWLLVFILSLVSLGATAYSGYSSNDKELAQRVTKTETHVEDDRATLQEIKAAQKAMDDKVTQILVIVGHPKH
jgi:hypothetical protein